MTTSRWYSVRCIFAMSEDAGQVLYEERITVWQASDMDEAIALSEAEAAEYAASLSGRYLGLAQAFMMSDGLVAGAEVFSLMRTSPLPRTDYLARHFDTGLEKQTQH